MKNYRIEFKWALVFSIVLLVWIVIEKLLGWHDVHINKYPIYTNLFAIPAVFIFILAIKDKKNNFFNGQITWQEGFMSGLFLSIIIATLSPLTQYIFTTYISPEFFKNCIKHAVEHKSMTEKAAKAFFNLASYNIQGIIGNLSMGVVTSALVSLYVRTKK